MKLTNSPGDDSFAEPPVTIPNTEVKCKHADGSATYVCARAGHCRAYLFKSRCHIDSGFFVFLPFISVYLL